MQESYEVTWDGRVIGAVILRKEGLYYRLFCRCRRPDGEIHRLYADGEKLGVLVPDRGELVLETKVAAKRLKEGCTFTIGENSGKFIPIHPDEPFEHLDKLRKGRLVFWEGQLGLTI